MSSTPGRATPLLEVRNLVVEFPGRRGTLRALDGVSFDIAPGEILGVVGESGAGKSLTGAAIIGLLEPPGRIAAGEVRLTGERIDTLPPAAMRRIRGRRIGAIFQDPLTSLNPLYTVGRQLVETIRAHMRDIADRFSRGDFAIPGFVHARNVPGTLVMADRQTQITYEMRELPGGAEVRIRAADPVALAAVHEFLAFQRTDHRTH